MNKRLLLLFVVLLFGLNKTFAQFTLSENFKGSTAPSIKLGNDARLTSGGADPVNQGWLRLTNDGGDQRGYAFIDKSFPSTLGVLVDFEYKTYHNESEGADGIVVFLFDGTITQADFQLGGTGAGLGYAPRGNQGLAGLKAGYLGIGLDEFGNFSSNFAGGSFTENTPSAGLALGRYPNSITLRGRESDKYRLLAMKTLPIQDNSTVQYTVGGTTVRPTDGVFYRRVQIEVKPNANGRYDIIVRWATTPGGAFTQLFTYSLVDQGGVSYAPPATLKLGFTSATGGSYNKHEVRNVTVTTPGNLRVSKRADKDFLRTVTTGNANKVTYTIDVVNDTQEAVNNVQFKDRLTDAV